MTDLLDKLPENAKARLSEIDLNDFDPTPRRDSDVGKAYVKDIKYLACAWALIPLAIVMCGSWLIGDYGAGTLSILVTALTGMLLSDIGSYEFINSNVAKEMSVERESFILEKIALVESEIGGIFQFSKLISFDGVANNVAKKWLLVLEQSAEKCTITDYVSYTSLLKQVISRLSQSEIDAERKVLEEKLSQLA